MHSHSIASWTHDHAFLGEHHGRHERRTWSVVTLTAVMMVVEIVGGTLFGSIALVADGWHMATHVAALAIAGLAYLFARRHADDARFSLGTGKFGELAAFASAIILGMIALGIGYEVDSAAFSSGRHSFPGGDSDRGARALRQSAPARGCCARTTTTITATAMTIIMTTHMARIITTPTCVLPMSTCSPTR